MGRGRAEPALLVLLEVRVPLDQVLVLLQALLVQDGPGRGGHGLLVRGGQRARCDNVRKGCLLGGGLDIGGAPLEYGPTTY